MVAIILSPKLFYEWDLILVIKKKSLEIWHPPRKNMTIGALPPLK